MRKRLIWTSATLALTVIAIAACGGSSATANPAPTSSCVNASAPRHAYVVIEHLSGAVVQKCVGFSTDAIDGKTLMDQSGIEYQAQQFSFGSAVCQIDSEPQQYSQCFPKDQPYWSLFTESGGQWTAASTGFTALVLHDKDAIGWHYVPQADASPAPPPAPKE